MRKRLAVLCGSLLAILLISIAFTAFGRTTGKTGSPGMRRMSRVDSKNPNQCGDGYCCPSDTLTCLMEGEPNSIKGCCPQGYPYGIADNMVFGKVGECYDSYQEALDECSAENKEEEGSCEVLTCK